MREKKYVLEGPPIPLARARCGRKRIWDSQKQIKWATGINLLNQHGQREIYTGPIHMTLTFFMKMARDKKIRQKVCGTYHGFKPDIDNLIKFVADAALGVLYKDDCIIASIHAQKLYDEIPRTEIFIRELTNS